MVDIDKLYTALKNIHTLIRNRGYTSTIPNLPKSLIKENVSKYGLEVLDIHVADPDRQVLVRFIDETNVRNIVKIIKFIYEIYNIQKSDDVILVNCQHYSLSHSNHLKILELENTDHENIRIFTLKQFQFDVVSNTIVPKHSIASHEQIKDVKKTYFLKDLSKLPIMLYSDPISRYYGYRNNMVIRIERKTGIVYRLVKKIITGVHGSYTFDIQPKEDRLQVGELKERVQSEPVDFEEDHGADEQKEDQGVSKPCNVRIGKKKPRGVKGAKNPIISGYKNIDATSGSVNKIVGHLAKLAFSPMYLGPIEKQDVTAKLFENYWQYSKVYKELGHIDDEGNVTDKWFEFRDKGFSKDKGDRHAIGTRSKDIIGKDSKGRNRYRYYTPTFAYYGGEKMDYITSRKKIYAPVYAELVKQQPAFVELKNSIEAGENIQILDIDGPTDAPSHIVTVDLLKQKINDTSSPFGHGYVLAGLLCGIEPDEYCM